MITCEKCAGDGLIGNGPNPHLKEGHITTCPDCNGTGKVEESNTKEYACAVCGTRWTASEKLPCPEIQNHPTQTVDNTSIPQPKRGILSIFRRNK